MCSDGSCQTTCTLTQDTNNKCASCPSNPGVSLKACRSTPLYVDIPNYQPKNATMQLYEACSNNMKTSVYSTWKDVQTNSLVWNICDAPKGMTFPINGKTIMKTHMPTQKKKKNSL